MDAEQWQHKIDIAFPRGVIMTEDTPDRGRVITMACHRPEVVTMHGEHPVVLCHFPAHDRNFRGEIRDWQELRTSPCLVVRVIMHMGGEGQQKDERQLWSGNISDAHAAQLDGDRRDSLRRSAEGELRWKDRPE